MKSFLILFVLLFFSCSADNDVEDDVVTITFLEKYEGTIWKNENSLLKVFNDANAISAPFEHWDYLNMDGFYCYSIFRYQLEPNTIINKNSNNSFEYEWTTIGYYNSPYTYLITITVDGNILTRNIKVKSLGNWSQNGNETYQRFSDNINDLPICGN